MQVITNTTELEGVCRRLAEAPFVAVDTEFMRETTYWPKLCLVQIASDELEIIIDPLAPGLDLSPFYGLMANERVVKVFHAARQDVEIVWTQARTIPKPLFDTQVAAMVCGFGEAISYVNLVKRITGHDLDKSSRFTDWAHRPLSERQLVYALGDVTHLREVYRHLERELAASGRRHWVGEEMAVLTNPETYETKPEEAWRRLKMRPRNRKSHGVLIELAAWRERQAQGQDVPRNRILRDEALFDIANQMPVDAGHLAKLRTVSDGFARSAKAREIIDVVKQGLTRDPKTLPPLTSAGSQLPPDASALIELLKVLLKACAARHDVAPRLIADASDLERIACEEEPDISALKGWRRELFGEEALRLKHGKVALTVRRGEVVTTPLGA